MALMRLTAEMDPIEDFERGYDLTDQTICREHLLASSHFGKNFDGVTATANQCSFCDRSDVRPFAIPFNAVLEVFMRGHRHHYGRADAQLSWDAEEHRWAGPTVDTAESVYEIGQGLFIDGAADDELEQHVLELITEALHDHDYTDLFSVLHDTEALHSSWSAFKRDVQYSHRFFPDAASRSTLVRLRDLASSGFGHVRSLPSGTSLFRGRLVERRDSLQQDAAARGWPAVLGAAPASLATANRMSPAGVAMLYASASPRTAVAEIASHGPLPLADVGEFRLRRDVQVLDLTYYVSHLSVVFDPAFGSDPKLIQDAQLAYFVRAFVDDITKPVVPDGRVHVEYAPTQLLTEFFRTRLRRRVDGIALPSAQTREPTFVFFFDGRDVKASGAPGASRRPALELVGHRVYQIRREVTIREAPAWS